MGTISWLVNPVKSAGELTTANAQLHRLRERQRREKRLPVLVATAKTTAPIQLPPHLGWGSERVPTRPASHSKPQQDPFKLTIIPAVADVANEAVSACPQTLAVHPSLLIALLKNEMVAIGRIWLLARLLDVQGGGWLTVDALRSQLTTKDSPLRVCGWRRLRQLLRAGGGIFWERDDCGRLWLYGTIRVARNLGVSRFTGDAISLATQELIGTIGAVRAACYTAFHCGRETAPISRATLEAVTGVAVRTQRHYDDAHATERITNLAFAADCASDQETVWQHGRAAFTFVDKNGRQGRAGERYTAIRLPNSYHSTRFARLSGKRKRLNHKLKQDLANHGTQGNSDERGQRLFFTDGKRAARVFNRQRDTYLRGQVGGNAVFWTGWLW